MKKFAFTFIFVFVFLLIPVFGLFGCGKKGGSIFAEKKYKVTFIASDTEHSVSLVEKGNNVKVPETPKLPGYKFDGWYTDQSLTAIFDFKTKITKNMTLYARFYDGNLTIGKSNGVAIVNSCKTSAKNVVVPNIFQGLTVEVINGGAFKNIESLESVQLPASIKEIGEEAFCNTGITSFILPAEVLEIKAKTFKDCSAIEEFVFADDSKIKKISDEAFSGCSSLLSFTIPRGVEELGGYLFENCSALSGVVVPVGVNVFGEGAFCGCSNLSVVRIPTGLVEVPNNFFKDCSSLAEIEFPYSVQKIGAHAFDGCGIVSLELPSTITYVFDYAFANCVNLESVNIPDNRYFKTLGDYVFSGCTALANVYIPSNLTSLSVGLFSGCTSLENYTIGDKIETIGEFAFADCSSLLNVVFGTKVNSIKQNAFKNCTGLEELEIPATVRTIESGALSGCSALVSLIIPFVGSNYNNSTASEETLFGYIFGGVSYEGGTRVKQYYNKTYDSDWERWDYNDYAYYCVPNSLKNVKVLAGGIYFGAFSNCTNLESVEYSPGSVWADSAFYGCSSLKSLTIPGLSSETASSTKLLGYLFGTRSFNGTTGIYQYYGSTNDERVRYYIPDSLEEVTIATWGRIAYGTFYGCNKIKSINFEDNVSTIPEKAFYGCTALEEMTLTGYLSSVGDNAFYGCSNLVLNVEYEYGLGRWGYVELSSMTSNPNLQVKEFYVNGLTLDEILRDHLSEFDQINSYVFAGCRAANITISDVDLKFAALSGITGLVSLTMPYAGGSRASEQLFGYVFGTTNYSGSTAINQYYNTSDRVKYYIPSTLNNVTITYSLGSLDWYFNACTMLENVTLLDCTLGERMFYGCTYLETVTFDNWGDIPAYAFYNCQSLTATPIDFEINNIGERAFYGCRSLTTVTFDDAYTIGSYAFENCTGLLSVTFNSIETIGSYAFSGCTSLQTILFPSGCGLNSIESYAFKNCSALASVVFPNTLETIGQYAFQYAGPSVVTFEANSYMETIGSYAFAGCTYLTSITIPEDVGIGTYAFAGCSNLQTVIFENNTYYGIETISAYAFSNCTSLTSITIPRTVTTIAERAFSGCSQLQTVTFENYSELTTIGVRAFYNCSSLTSFTIPENVTNAIGSYAFSGCTALAEVIINSEYIFRNTKSSTGSGNLINYATKVYVNYDFDDDTPNTYFKNTSRYTRTYISSGAHTGYYLYEKVGS